MQSSKLKYKLIHSLRKSISISINKDGLLIVRAPYFVAKSFIDKFINKKSDWIKKQQAKILPAKKFVVGEEFLFMGNQYTLKIDNRLKSNINLKGDLLVKKIDDSTPKKLEKWYKNEARKYFQDKLDEFCSEFGFEYKSLKLSSAKTRWGSCSGKDNLNLNWKLIMADSEIIDYVILHELVHTEIKNHSRKFWKKVEEVCPSYKARRKWLKDNGHKLIL